jgi:hypothetical protein
MDRSGRFLTEYSIGVCRGGLLIRYSWVKQIRIKYSMVGMIGVGRFGIEYSIGGMIGLGGSQLNIQQSECSD